MKQVDARGLPCPGPVLQTKAVIDADRPCGITVMVDNETSRQNVHRFLASKGFDTVVRERGGAFYVTGTREVEAKPAQAPEDDAAADFKKIMVLVGTDTMGHGDDMLGAELMVNFLKTVKEMGPELWRLVFINSGVKLTAEDSEVLPDLRGYEASGLQILVCDTCLEHFELRKKMAVGETGNMLDIVTAMQLADKVINI